MNNDQVNDFHEVNTIHPQTYIFDTKVKIYEDESHEFKQIHFPSVPEVLPKLKKLMKYLCAFLNSNSGVLYIGITDDGFIKGIKLNDELYNELEYQISDMINHFEDHVINEKFITYQFNSVMNNYNKPIDGLYVVVIFVKVGLPDHIYTTPLKDDEYQDYLCYIKLNGTIKMITGNNLYKYIKNKIKKYVLRKLIKN